ncbi:T9SS type A sorting domain-containing protein, partial [Calditrichota bacterium]
DGNGDVNWQMTRVYPDVEAEPFTLLEEMSIAEIVNNDRIEGVAFIQGHYYVSGSNDDDHSYIYVVNREGEYLNRFMQPTEERLGVTDLAWDGQHLWMAKSGDLWGVTLDGELEIELDGPTGSGKNVAWDPGRQLLWVSATTSDIYGVASDGEVIVELDRHGFYTSGLAYHPDDPDGYNLYILHELIDTGTQSVHKMNIETGDTMWVVDLAEGIEPGGAEIVYDWDTQSWVFMNISQVDSDDGGDQINVWQLGPKTGWARLNAESGMIPGGEQVTLELILDAGWLANDTYTQDLIFTHDGFVGADTVSIELEVIRPMPPATPTDLTVSEDEPRLVMLNWTNMDENASYNVIERRNQNEEAFSFIGEVLGDQSTYTDSVETIYLRYYYRVRATNIAGVSGYSNVVDIRPQGGPPSAFDLETPENGATLLLDTGIDSTMVEYNWNETLDPDPEDTGVTYMLWIAKIEGDSMSFAPEGTSLTLSLDSLVKFDFTSAFWWVTAESGPHTIESSERFGFDITVVSVGKNPHALPVAFGLHQIYPNPFNSMLTIEYGIPAISDATLSIYDLTGRQVGRLFAGSIEPGMHIQEWNARDMPGGVYIVRLEDSQGNRALRKALLLK